MWIIENAANLVKTEALTKYSLARALHQPMGFSGSSAGKESTCNAGDPSLIPGSVRSSGEGIGTPVFLGFPCGSAGKESACNERDPGSIPGLGRSSGEGTDYLLQYSWASLVAQLVKNPSAM